MINSAPLRTALRGDVILPGEERYDGARAIWNALIDNRPALIIRPKGVSDVSAAVGFAAENHLPVSVCGGGHNVAGTAVCQDGIMIDLSAMRSVTVDPARRTARVEGGATLADLDRETQKSGLAVPGGVVSSTGAAGLTLGGGFGWLSRRFGLAADNLLAVDIVTADGNMITASDHEHRDLFWGLRGGSGNFGVAVAFVFRLHNLGPDVLFGPTVYRLEDAGDVLRHYRAFAKDAPRECCVWADLMTAPPMPFLPERYHGEKVLTLMQCHSGDLAEGEAELAPLRGFGAPIGDAVGPMQYVEAQQILDETYAKGLRNYWKSTNFRTLPDVAIEKLVKFAATMPTPETDMLICQLGGAIGDVPSDATAFPHRDTNFIVTPGARWRAPKDDERCLAWIREVGDTLAQDADGGQYVNFISEGTGQESSAYGANYARLKAVKTAYDPENRFRSNQNVRPEC